MAAPVVAVNVPISTPLIKTLPLAVCPEAVEAPLDMVKDTVVANAFAVTPVKDDEALMELALAIALALELAVDKPSEVVAAIEKLLILRSPAAIAEELTAPDNDTEEVPANPPEPKLADFALLMEIRIRSDVSLPDPTWKS